MIAELPIRDATRLPDYDYSSPGAYFVTVCCQSRNPFFDFEPAKAMVESVWRDIPNQFTNAKIDIFVVMPDHFHGIIIMKSNDNVTVGERPRALPLRRLTTGDIPTNGKAQGPSPTGKRPDLPDVSDTLKKAKRITKPQTKPELGI